MKRSLITLSLGTFGLGIAEFSVMSVLPNLANSFGIGITQAGHLISAYALGVCVGAPLIVLLARNWKLNNILKLIMSIFVVGHFTMALSNSYAMGMVARFISGMPHGAYFGTGVIVANRLADEGKSAVAVSIMVMGMAISNLLGVPFGSWIGQHLSWRFIFSFNTIWGLLTLLCIAKFIPEMAALPRTNFKGQFRFLKRPEPWLVILGTMFGNGGAFCWFSYINPLMTEVSGFSSSAIPVLMFVAGCGMCIGNYLGGVLADRFAHAKVAMYTQLSMSVALMLIFLFAQISWFSAVMMFVCTTGLFTLSSPQQLLIMHQSEGSELMGGAMVQIAFNFGNALGAYFGGLPIAFGLGYKPSSAMGAAVVLVGFASFFVLNLLFKKKSIIR